MTSTRAKERLADRISGGLLLVLGLAVVVTAYGFYVPYQYEPLGPKAMPYLVGGILMLCGVRLVAVQPQRAMAQSRAQGIGLWWHQLLLMALLLGYGLAYELLGFVVANIIVSFGLAWLCGARLIWCCAVALGLTLAGHLVLVQVLGLQLPAGLLQGWL